MIDSMIDKRPAIGYNGLNIMAQVTVYSKPGCHLCEEAVRVLTQLQARAHFTLEEINIQHDPALLAEYGEQVPVGLLNGKFLFEYTVDDGHVRQIISATDS